MNKEPSQPKNPSLKVTDLSFRYRPDTPELFAGLKHSFTSGAVTVVTGPSGCGKSTLLYVLGLMLRPQKGDVILSGYSTRTAPDSSRSAARARDIGFVFQDSALDPARPTLDSVIEPALYAGSRRTDVSLRARKIMTQFGVGTLVASRPGQISGGQAQRIALARSMMNNPAIILADEPTGNLDRSNAQSVLDALKVMSTSGRIVVVASHDPFIVENADEVLAL